MSDSQAQGRFQPGQSGNPNGRPRGAVNRKTKLLQEICDEDAINVWGKIKAGALAGDPTALRIYADRTLPPRRERGIEFECPELRSQGDVPAVLRAVTNGCLQGDVGIADAIGLLRMLEAFTRRAQKDTPEEPSDSPEKKILEDENFAKAMESTRHFERITGVKLSCITDEQRKALDAVAAAKAAAAAAEPAAEN